MPSKFSPPVWISDGPLTIRMIATVEQAHAYLRGWRGPKAAAFDHTLKTLEDALNGKADALKARSVFRLFAAAEKILAEADPNWTEMSKPLSTKGGK